LSWYLNHPFGSHTNPSALPSAKTQSSAQSYDIIPSSRNLKCSHDSIFSSVIRQLTSLTSPKRLHVSQRHYRPWHPHGLHDRYRASPRR
jgi:hypothetical protein